MLSRTSVRLEACTTQHEPLQLRTPTARELFANCGEIAASGSHAGASRCLLDEADGSRFRVGTRTRASPNKVARGLGAIMLTGLVGYCAAECENPPATLGLAALTVGYLLIAQPLAIFSGGR